MQEIKDYIEVDSELLSPSGALWVRSIALDITTFSNSLRFNPVKSRQDQMYMEDKIVQYFRSASLEIAREYIGNHLQLTVSDLEDGGKEARYHIKLLTDHERNKYEKTLKHVKQSAQKHKEEKINAIRTINQISRDFISGQSFLSRLIYLFNPNYLRQKHKEIVYFYGFTPTEEMPK